MLINWTSIKNEQLFNKSECIIFKSMYADVSITWSL